MRKKLLGLLFIIFSFTAFSKICITDVTISSSGTSICSGTSIVLTAQVTGGTAPYNYVWNTGEKTPSISVNKAGTYTVSVSDNTPGCQPITKSITITSLITPNAPTAANQFVCPNSSATLKATGPGGTYQWYDSPVDGIFLNSGDTYITPLITETTTFYVQTTVSGCTSSRSPVTVFVTGKPSVTGATLCAGGVATLSASGGDSYTWYNAASGGNEVGTGPTFITPVLSSTTTYYVVAVIRGCTSVRTPVTARVTSPPPPPSAENTSTCVGSSATLHADAPDGVFDWFDVPTGGTSLISSPDYTTPPLTTTTTYYVQTTVNDCQSDRKAVTVTVNPIPQAPPTQTVSICSGTSTTLTADPAPTGSYAWYDQPNGGTLLKIGTTFQTPVLTNSIIYYVQHITGTCTSERTAVNVNITPPPAAPAASEPVICSGAVATLTATSTGGGTFQWYNTATGGTLLSPNATYVTPALTANTTYYVQTTEAGCISARTPVTVRVLQPVPAPTVPATSVCSGNSAILVASGSPDNYEWYDAATGGNLLVTGSTYVTPVLTSTQTYYVQSTANDCTSPRKAVTVTVDPIPSAPTANGTSVCPGTSANLTASAPSGTIEWYDAPTGGTLLASSNTFSTPILVEATTYYVQNINGSCVSPRRAVTVDMIATTNPSFKYESGTFCTAGANPSPTINVPGGSFSATPAGLTYVSTATGEINIAASIPGKYTILYTYGGACPGSTSADVTITSITNAQFSYNGPFCTSDPNPLPVFRSGTSAGVFSASPSGLVFKNTTTGEIDLSASKSGTYTVTNTISATVGCSASTSNAQVTIFEKATANAGPNQIVPSGTPVDLIGQITGGATSGTWKGGAGSFSDKTTLRTIYTPRNGETKATLTLTSADPAGPCGPVSSSVTITFNSIPAEPTVISKPVCIGNSATLIATAPGGTYKWFDAASGGTELFTGPIFNTPPLTTSTTYYVQVTKGGLTSSRKAVTVDITPTPEAPQFTISPACVGGTATLTASGSTGTYRWYDAPVGGTLLETNAVYVTPVLNADKSYYVQTTVNGCTSPRAQVDVKVTQPPHVISAATGTVCSGTALDYTIKADMAATFSWSRAAVAGISNEAATGTSELIDEKLINTGNNTVNVKYIITPIANGCSGPSFTYQVMVNPLPTVASTPADTICNGTTDNYAIKFQPDNSGASTTWSRAAVDGISNAAVSGQTASVIKEVLFNTTTAPISATYVFNYRTSNCQGPPFNLVMTVNPAVKITSDLTGTACSGTPQNYTITSNIPSATFNWKRDAVTNITNPAVSDQTNSIIDESLINTGPVPVKVTYIITATAFGCSSKPFAYVVTVNPQLNAPIANSNTPVCEGSTIQLRTPSIPRATYKWTGPNGYTSTSQNPDITNVTAANSGTYNLYVTLNDCTSEPTPVDVKVNAPAVVDAGPDQTQCITATAINLAGSVISDTNTGIWTSDGTGTFLPISADKLDGQYIPSAQDKANGSVKLTLSSTSKDDCTIVSSDMTITFAPSPAADAGPDLDVCSQDESVKVDGKILIQGGALWSTSGTGTFSPQEQPETFYQPSAADIQSGSVTLTLTATAAGICDIPTDKMTLKFTPPPTLNAGGTRYVLKDRTITLNPTVSDENVQYLWSPSVGLSSNTVKNPVLTGDVDRTYTLQITDSRGCVSTDKTFIKVSPQLIIPNTFTPNGDGSNDFWDIRGLIAYENAIVDVFNRYGQQLFHSVGYSKPWEGLYNGQPVPAGTYYYKINTKENGEVLSGYVLILR